LDGKENGGKFAETGQSFAEMGFGGDDERKEKAKIIVVRLNGWIHTDAKLALKDIALP